MGSNYTVQQGDHLAKIAKEFGIPDYHRIWDAPENADLRKLRDNPHVLFPGDVIFVPDLEMRTESRATDALHSFTVKKKTLHLRIIAENYDFEPLATTPCQLQVEFENTDLTTDGAGLIDLEIKNDAENGTLRISGAEIPLKIGHLDPVTEITGQRARLNSLGYNAGPVDKDSPEQFRSAVEEFQCDHKLTVDGICGPATQAKLKAVHGS
jgi:hypothetical protein